MGNFGGSASASNAFDSAAYSYADDALTNDIWNYGEYLSDGDMYNPLGDTYASAGSSSSSGGLGKLASGLGGLFKNYGGTILNSLGGAGLAAADNNNRQNAIKASYYKNPYLMAALDQTYKLDDNISNLSGLMKNLPGIGNNSSFLPNLFSSSLVNNGKNFTINPSDLKGNLDYGLDALGGQGVLMSGDAYSPEITPSQYNDYSV